MDSCPTSDNAVSTILVRAVLFWFTSVLAGLTLLTHISQIVGLSFELYVYIGLGIAVLASAIALRLLIGQLRNARQRDVQVLAAVVVLGALGMVFGLVSYKPGPTPDDYIYVPNAVYHLENPQQPMDFGIHFQDGAGCSIQQRDYTSLAFEYSQSAIAFFSGLAYLFVYYLLTPSFICFLIVLAYFLLLSNFVDSTVNAAFGTLCVVGIVVLFGELPRSFGNFSFTHAWQGKTLLMAVGIPLFAALSIQFFRNPGLYIWVSLFTCAIAMAGASTSTIALLPALAAVLLVAYVVSSQNRNRVPWTALFYLMSLAYVVLYALFLLAFTTVDLRSSSLNAGFPSSFWGQAELLFSKDRPVILIVVGLTTIMSLCLTVGSRRRFLASWVVALLVLFLNPLISPVVMHYIASPAIYWRLFFLVPYPLTIGTAGAMLFARLEGLSTPWRTAVVSATCLALIAMHIPSFSTSIFRSNVQIAWPSYKLPRDLLQAATSISSIPPKGTMLAPSSLAGVIPMVDSGYPQMNSQNYGTLLWLGMCGLNDEALQRINASLFVAGGDSAYLPAFRQVLQEEALRSIVLTNNALGRQDIGALLASQGFTNQRAIPGYVVVWR